MMSHAAGLFRPVQDYNAIKATPAPSKLLKRGMRVQHHSLMTRSALLRWTASAASSWK